MLTPKKLGILWAAAVLVIFSATGAIVYKGHKKSQDKTAIVAALADTTRILREVLGPGSADAAARIDAHLTTIKAASPTPLSVAAEDYILGAREIARHRADAARYKRQAAAARQALRAHMGAGGRRGEAWFRTAKELKKRMEDEYFGLGVALKALDGLLFSMGDSVKRTAPLAGEKAVAEQSLFNAARQENTDELKRAAADLEQARRLPVG